MTVTIAFPPTVEQKLKEHAAASGKDVETFVLEAVEEKLAAHGEAMALEIDLLRDLIRSGAKRSGTGLPATPPPITSRMTAAKASMRGAANE